MKRNTLNLALIVAAVISGAVSAAAQDAFETVRRAMADHDLPAAVAELEKMEKSDASLFALNNYDYLLGRLRERKGDLAAAAASYNAVAARGSVLKPYALWHLAAIMRASGNLIGERIALQEILTVAPDAMVAEAASARIARSYFESRNYDDAIRQLAVFAGGTTNLKADLRVRENLVLLGEAYLNSGKAAEARDVFQKLVDNLPNPAQPDDFALAGAIGLDRLDAGADFGKKAPQLPDHIHLQRALIYQFNRDFADARLHYQAIIERYPESGNVPDAMFQIGRGYVQGADYKEALKWFEKLIEKFPDHPSAKDALTQSASAYARLGDAKTAIARYQAFIDKYPTDERLDRAYLNIVDVHRDANDDKAALEWTARTQDVFRGKTPEAVALFSQLRIRAAASNWESAVADADRLLTLPDLGGTRVPGGTTIAEVTFMRAFALENLKRFPEAIDGYLSIADGRAEYYGWRATERLRKLASTPEAASAIGARIEQLKPIASRPADASNADEIRRAAQSLYRINGDEKLLTAIAAAYQLIDSYKSVPAFKFIDNGRRNALKSGERNSSEASDELLYLWLYDEAGPEFERWLMKRLVGGPDLEFTRAEIFRRGDMAHRAIAFIEPLWRKIPADYQIELIPRDQAEMLYPTPYVDSLLASAPPRGVDPRFVLSIMRQESRYRADVKSVAAARGLMQFISTTSNRIAAALGRKDFRQDELYDPPTSILFGSQYLADIYREFPGKHEAVAASYNGGEDNMRRWLARARADDAERYVPEIIFAQSKDYAWKVVANFRMYQALYDERLRRRSASK